MKSKICLVLNCVVVIGVILISLSTADARAKETVLRRFDSKHGAYPTTDLIADSHGNFYGTANGGLVQGQYCGSYGCGGVYEFSPLSNGKWKYSVIYSFKGGSDGAWPVGRLLMDQNGNLYGVDQQGPNGGGTLYELTKSGGTWKETIIYAFPGFSGDGQGPDGDLAMDANGNLYGNTVSGGANGLGTVFRLSPSQRGGWTETILHSFGNGNDGIGPTSGVAIDGRGNLFGITGRGGNNNSGTVFEISPANGQWKYSTIYHFDAYTTGCCSYTPLTLDAQGNIYGMTARSGPKQEGIIFELSYSAGRWREITIYDVGLFQRVVFDGHGDLLGADLTGGNGCYGGCGAIEELKPVKGGWKLVVLHNFQAGGDGSRPVGLLIGNDGNFYGPTQYGGGMYGYGTLYQIIP